MQIEYAADPLRAATVAALEALRATIEAHGRARFAISGGSAADGLGPITRTLGDLGLWSQVCITWVDERCVPFADADSNRGTDYRRGRLHEEVAAGFELPLFRDGETPEAACSRVREALAREFDGGLDVVLLGMGEDGHVASLFPGRPLPEGPWVGHVTKSPKPPPDRITLLPEILQTAAHTFLPVFGAAKREAVERLQRGEPDQPASWLRAPHIFTDLVSEL